MSDSDLTKRAREVLTGLSPAQRDSVRRMSVGSLWLGYVRTTDALERRGVCWARRLTDLGREVARLIAAGES